jgi:hypothetical protein
VVALVYSNYQILGIRALAFRLDFLVASRLSVAFQVGCLTGFCMDLSGALQRFYYVYVRMATIRTSEECLFLGNLDRLPARAGLAAWVTGGSEIMDSRPT